MLLAVLRPPHSICRLSGFIAVQEVAEQQPFTTALTQLQWVCTLPGVGLPSPAPSPVSSPSSNPPHHPHPNPHEDSSTDANGSQSQGGGLRGPLIAAVVVPVVVGGAALAVLALTVLFFPHRGAAQHCCKCCACPDEDSTSPAFVVSLGGPASGDHAASSAAHGPHGANHHAAHAQRDHEKAGGSCTAAGTLRSYPDLPSPLLSLKTTAPPTQSSVGMLELQAAGLMPAEWLALPPRPWVCLELGPLEIHTQPSQPLQPSHIPQAQPQLTSSTAQAHGLDVEWGSMLGWGASSWVLPARMGARQAAVKMAVPPHKAEQLPLGGACMDKDRHQDSGAAGEGAPGSPTAQPTPDATAGFLGAAAAIAREALLLSRMEHPNVVAVLGCSAPGNEVPYLVQELVGGGSLASLLLGLRKPVTAAAPPPPPAAVTSAGVAAEEEGTAHADQDAALLGMHEVFEVGMPCWCVAPTST